MYPKTFPKDNCLQLIRISYVYQLKSALELSKTVLFIDGVVRLVSDLHIHVDFSEVLRSTGNMCSSVCNQLRLF